MRSVDHGSLFNGVVPLGEWETHRETLRRTAEVVAAWEPEAPDPSAARCAQSRHRTLAHLRACQEQWLLVAVAFAERERPSVRILHPWRAFEVGGYALVGWDEHLRTFLSDRARWLALAAHWDPMRGGKMNGKPETIGTLTRRLALHETHHLSAL